MLRARDLRYNARPVGMAAASRGQRIPVRGSGHDSPASMGTVIALDALYMKEAKYHAEHFVTMGSPLGLTAVQLDLTYPAGRRRTMENSYWMNSRETLQLPGSTSSNAFTRASSTSSGQRTMPS